jgi:hypothetical protein
MSALLTLLCISGQPLPLVNTHTSLVYVFTMAYNKVPRTVKIPLLEFHFEAASQLDAWTMYNGAAALLLLHLGADDVHPVLGIYFILLL